MSFVSLCARLFKGLASLLPFGTLQNSKTNKCGQIRQLALVMDRTGLSTAPGDEFFHPLIFSFTTERAEGRVTSTQKGFGFDTNVSNALHNTIQSIQSSWFSLRVVAFYLCSDFKATAAFFSTSHLRFLPWNALFLSFPF